MPSALPPHRTRATPCRWHGRHAGEVTAGVLIGWPCGHTEGPATATCAGHLDHLLTQSGRAENRAPCPVCGILGAGAVIGTQDLDFGPATGRTPSADIVATLTATIIGLAVFVIALRYLPYALVCGLFRVVSPDPDPLEATVALVLCLAGCFVSAAAGYKAGRYAYQPVRRWLINPRPLCRSQWKDPEAL